ncbi:MAG: 2Fe-2S iron-sulfur cluster-binding protein [Planctomycetota bacterium]
MPRLTIDGRTVEVTPGSNLLAATRKLGLDVPALCYFPGLPASTCCMACVVKLRAPAGGQGGADGADRIVPACATPACDGMVVESETAEMHGLRKVALELLLSDHDGSWSDDPAGRVLACENGADAAPAPAGQRPSVRPPPFDCDCPKASICRLRRYAREYGCRPERYAGARRSHPRQFEHPEITFDPGKCIMCGICVQLAQQAGEELGLTLVGRGFDVRLDVPFGGTLAEALRVAARQIAAACPTSALAQKPG